MYRKTPSEPVADSSAWASVRNRIGMAQTFFRRLVRRHPFYFLTGMLVCMIASAILAFTVMRTDTQSALPALPLPESNGVGNAIGGMVRTYGTLQEIAEIQREIQAIIEKDSLTATDSIRLIHALQRFEQLHKTTPDNKNSTP
jgi:hypothetical protein